MKTPGKRWLLIVLGCMALLALAAGPASALSVTAAMPKGEVKDLAQITVRFSEPMRALGVAEQDAKTAPLRLAVTGGMLPSGNFRWLDPHTLAYIFDAPVSHPLAFTVSVPAGARSLSGKTLARGTSWKITTPPLHLSVYRQGKNTLPRKNAVIYIQANYPLDTALLRAKTRVTHDGKTIPASAVSIGDAQPTAWQNGRPSAWRYQVTLKSFLSGNSSVTLAIGSGVKAKDGGIPATAFAIEIPTYKTLRLDSWRFESYARFEQRDTADKTETENVSPEARLSLSFNNPVDYRELMDHLSISPPAPFPAGAARGSRSAQTYQLLPHIWQPRTTYTVTVKKGLKDEYGTVLAKDRVVSFTTGDYRPLVYVPGNNDAVLETPIANVFPITLRNAGKFSVLLRYIPWGGDALTVLRENLSAPSGPVAGSRETEVLLDITKRPNINVREAIDIPKALGFSSAKEMNGLVILSAKGEVLEAINHSIRTHVQISDLGLAVRIGEKNGLAWVTGLTSGKPVAGVAVRVADATGTTLWKGATDAAGAAILPGYDKLYGARFCIAESNDETSVLDLGKYLVPASAKEHEKAKEARIPWRVHAVAQMPLYQPGQTVNAVLIARRHAGSGKGALEDFADWKALPGETVRIEVKDRNDTVVHAEEATTDAYGTAPFSFTLSPAAEPGWYEATAFFKDSDRKSSVYAFQVASFRPPDFKVDLRAPASQPLPPANANRLSVKVAAGYFSGPAVKNGTVELEVVENESYFIPGKLRGYRVGPEMWPFSRHRGPARLQKIAGTLNAEGETALTLPAFATQAGLPVSISLTATVADAAGLATQGAASFLLHPSEYYVGLRAPFIMLPEREAAFQLKAATWDDKTLTGKTVTVTAKRVTPDKDAFKETVVWERSVPLKNEAGDSFNAAFAASGQYVVTASIVDDTGRANITSTRVYVPGPGGDWVRTQPGQRLEFLHEDTVYAPGGTAKVVLKNPFETATALVSLERDGVLRSFVTEVSGAAPLIEIPLGKMDAPYVYASVTLVKGRTAPPPDAFSPEGSADEGAPALAQGSLLLKVAGARETLAATVTSDKKAYRPGETVKTEVSVVDGAGKGKKCQVTLLAVDERYLRAAGERTLYHPAATFSEQFPAGVLSADTWRHILNRSLPVSITTENKHRVKSIFAPSPSIATAAGVAQEAMDATPARVDFTPLAFWLAAKETDDSGKLSASFTLPDSITSYRVIAVAYDAKSAFAVGETSVTASLPLQILSALPKFVTEDDTLFAAVLIQNNSKTRGAAVVSAKIAGDAPGTALETDTQTLFLNPGESRRATFTLKAGKLTEAEGSILLDVSARMRMGGETETDAARFTLPVKSARPLTTVAAAGLMKENETLALPVKAPANLDPRSKMTVTFAPSPAAGVPLAAKQVIDYPWNCLEQRLSRAWARVLRVRHGEFLGLPADASDTAKIAEEFAAIPAYQAQNGRFSLWPGSGANDGGLFLTSYALLVNDSAKETGVTLPEKTTKKALAFILNRLENLSKERNGSGDSPDAFALALRALSLHDPEKAASLLPSVWAYCRANETNPIGLASLLFVLHTAKSPSNTAPIVAEIREALEKTAAVTATEMHFASAHESVYWRTLGSKLRDNAYTLAALAVAEPDYPRLEALARWVGQRLGDTRTLSTQEAAFGVWGLTFYLQSLGGDRETAVTAIWNGKDEAGISFKRLMDAPASWIIAPEKLNGGNDSTLQLVARAGRPYWTARLTYASPETAAKAENAGFTLTRTMGRGQERGKTAWKIGDTATVTLTLTVPATRRHVALFDPFPAGFEPVFATRVDVADNAKTWQYPWMWQDAVGDGMLLYAPSIDPGTYTFTYTLRAAAGGAFTQRPAFVEEMYTPETFGRTAPGSVTVAE